MDQLTQTILASLMSFSFFLLFYIHLKYDEKKEKENKKK